jgi:hypothetical protein
MRWLLLKDLQILRRSPLLVALLVVYPLLIGALVVAARAGDPSKPPVAFANLVPPGGGEFSVGGEKLDASAYAERLFESVEPIRVGSRAEAIAKVRSGEALGALIVPADVTERLQATINLTGGEPPELEVIYTGEDPAKRRLVEAAIESRLAEANDALSERLVAIAAQYIGIIVKGGEFSLLGQTFDVLGLERAETVLRAVLDQLPADAPERAALEQVVRFAGLAADNLDVSGPILASIGAPVRVKQTVLGGSGSSIDAYAIVAAVTVCLMFVALLLGAGTLAMEREEHAFGRLMRGLVRPETLLAEKAVLAALASGAVALLLVAVLAAAGELDAARIPAALAPIALAGTAFGAMGLAIGALAREVRVASLFAFMLSLPVALLGVVPEGSVGAGIYDLISAVSAVFPFRPALQALDGALNDGDVLRHLAHLAALTLGFAALARLALRRLA